MKLGTKYDNNKTMLKLSPSWWLSNKKSSDMPKANHEIMTNKTVNIFEVLNFTATTPNYTKKQVSIHPHNKIFYPQAIKHNCESFYKEPKEVFRQSKT